MSKSWIRAIALFVAACVCWYVEIVINPSGLEPVMALLAVISTVLCVCFLVIAVLKHIKPNVSAYKIFAVTDILIGIGVTIYAIYDILTDTGWFAGLVGMLLLIIVLPVILLLLIIDFIVFMINKRSRCSVRQFLDKSF